MFTGEYRNPLCDLSPERAPQASSKFFMFRVWSSVRGKKPSASSQDMFCVLCQGVRSHMRKEEMVAEINEALGLMCIEDSAGEIAWVFAPLIEKGKARVGRLKGYGNAICAPQAQAFIEAFMEITLADHLLSTPADDITVSNSHGHHPNHPRRNPL